MVVDRRQQLVETFRLTRLQRPSVESFRRGYRLPLFHEFAPSWEATRMRETISGGIGTAFMGSLGTFLTQTMVMFPVATTVPAARIVQTYRIFFSPISAMRIYASNSSSKRNGREYSKDALTRGQPMSEPRAETVRPAFRQRACSASSM